jgi:hypothetical protein
MESVLTVVVWLCLVFVYHLCLRIRDYGCCGTPCSVPLLHTEKMGRECIESIDESSGRLWRRVFFLLIVRERLRYRCTILFM